MYLLIFTSSSLCLNKMQQFPRFGCHFWYHKFGPPKSSGLSFLFGLSTWSFLVAFVMNTSEKMFEKVRFIGVSHKVTTNVGIIYCFLFFLKNFILILDKHTLFLFQVWSYKAQCARRTSSCCPLQSPLSCLSQSSSGPGNPSQLCFK